MLGMMALFGAYHIDDMCFSATGVIGVLATFGLIHLS